MWNNLKAAINSAIKTNNNQEITGQILQNTLNSIVNTVGANATFAGVATPSTSPGTPDGPVFWLAWTAGIYSNFNNTELSAGQLGVFLWNGSTWSSNVFNWLQGFSGLTDEQIAQILTELHLPTAIDDKPTAASDNLVKSGGVAKQIGQLKEIIGGVTEALSVDFVGTGGIYAVDYQGHLGEINTGITNSKYSDYVDISNHSILSLNYLRMTSTSQQKNILIGMCFYDANKVAISGITNLGDQSSKGTIDFTITDIPANAAYIRFICYNEFVGGFYASVKCIDTVSTGGLVKQVNDLNNDVKDVKSQIDNLERVTQATQGLVTTLNGRVDDLEEIVKGSSVIRVTTNLASNFVGAGAIRSRTYDEERTMGTISSNSICQYTNYVNIANYANKNTVLTYINCVYNVSQTAIGFGLCFYDSNKVAISAEPFKGDAVDIGYETNTINVPTNAAYIRFTCLNQYTDIFSASVTYDDIESGLVNKVDNLEIDVEVLKSDVDSLKGVGIKIIENKSIDSSTGNIIDNYNYNCTDYIKINNYEKFSIPSFTVSAPSVIGLAFYNRDKQYVSGIHYPYNTGYSFVRYIAPAEACYVRFTVLPNIIPYINIESNAPIAPYFNTYLAFNTPQAKGQFKIFMNFNNGVMLGSCGQDKLDANDDTLIYRSTDWGITWTYLGNATQETSLKLREGIYYGDHDRGGNAIVGSGDQSKHYLLKVTNYGESWPSDYKVVANATSINDIVGKTTNGVENVVYCGNNTYRAFCNSMGEFTGYNAVIESNDGGETWHAAASTQPLLASLRTVYRDSKGVLWGAGMHGDRGVWKSTDNGLNWSRKSYFLAFQSIIEYNGYLFCGAINANTTEGYVYRSTDDGETWDKVLTIAKFTPIYHRTFIPYKNALIAVFCQGEGSTSVEVSWQVSLDNGDSWGEIKRAGIYEGGFVELACIIGDSYYINTHGGLQKM